MVDKFLISSQQMVSHFKSQNVVWDMQHLNNIGYAYYRVLEMINYDGISFITVVLKKFHQGYSSFF